MKRAVIKVIAVICVIALCAAGGFAYWKFNSEDDSVEQHDFKITLPRLDTGKYPDDSTNAQSERPYSVSTSNDIATAVGMSVLAAGGNAVDAAVAISYTLGISEPYASGIGGGGGMLVYEIKTGKCTFYDYRACAGSAYYSSDEAAVPGLVAGMAAVHKDYGTISMYDLITPAIEYAENGYTIGGALFHRINYSKHLFGGYDWFFDENGRILNEGDTIYHKKYAQTLRDIRRDGPDVFYKGYIAEDIAAVTDLTTADLASYEVIKSEALEGYFEGNTVYGCGGPLSGMTLIQMLEMADELDTPDPRYDPLTFTTHLKRFTAAAYSDRYKHVADRTYYSIDEQSYISKSYIYELLDMEPDENAFADDESMETTSFSVVDSNGLVVS